MCGICGVLHLDNTPATREEVLPMVDLLVHRGPDQGGVVVAGACALGNRRLAILDLSPSGALPMRSDDDRLTIAYNGEVYNHPQLRQQLELEGEHYRTGSDTESILKLYRRDGVELLRSLRGMFAFALWDRDQQRLLIARDRLGEKPLYYYQDSRVFVFASEIKALLAHSAVPRVAAFTPESLAAYLAYGYLPDDQTAFKDIKMLPPAQRIVASSERITRETYWTAPLPVDAQPVTPAYEREQADALNDALGAATRQALISDVPLGAFLSGGLDSSLIVALMRRHSNADIKTFSIGFEGDASFDETRYAQQVADHLHTEHTAFTVKPQTLDLLPLLVWHHDQPFGDSSAIPTYLVSKLTREHVTVALTGDGGDELFAGYERFYALDLIRRLDVVPRRAWGALAGLLNRIPEGTGYYNILKRGRRFVQGAAQSPALAYFDFIRLFDARQLRRLNPALGSAPLDYHYRSYFNDPDRATLPDLLQVNLKTYLPGDLLVKTDRSSMAASLETRAPFLDHPLVELAASIPANLKLKGSVTKYILKESARDLLPASIIDRPKHGFGVPLGTWLRQDSSRVREVLLSREARERGWFDAGAVEALIDEHVSGRRDHGQRLWSLLTLEWWYRLYIDPPVIQQP